MRRDFTTAWEQLPTLNLVAANPAALIDIPGIEAYRKYGLLIAPVEGVSLVMGPIVVDGTIKISSMKSSFFGVWSSQVSWYLYAAAPTPVVITPYASRSGQLTGIPVVLGR